MYDAASTRLGCSGTLRLTAAAAPSRTRTPLSSVQPSTHNAAAPTATPSSSCTVRRLKDSSSGRVQNLDGTRMAHEAATVRKKTAPRSSADWLCTTAAQKAV